MANSWVELRKMDNRATISLNQKLGDRALSRTCFRKSNKLWKVLIIPLVEVFEII
jgi:hypothetical protein